MRELWRKSFELFRSHLVLWVPCVCAGLLTLALGRLEKAAVLKIVHSLMTRHTVLGGDVTSADPNEFERLALVVLKPVGLCKDFLEVCFYVVALAMTAKLVGMIFEGKKPDILAALKEIAPEWRGILMFSLKYLVALGVTGAVMILITSSALVSQRLLEIVASKAFVYPVGLALEAGVAWVLMPAAMRLLQTPNVAQVSVQCRRLGTVFAVLTSAAALGLEYIVGSVEAKVVLDNQWELTAVSALNSIVVNAPEVLLFIALAWLAVQHFPEVETTNGSRLREFWRGLMPLHFGPNQEP
ncbi:MAG TPA: hypothetical protein VME23_01965 [Terracidiphilus sp.]|nr:hypothetical protein [Terracidiphilus sp.]